MTIIDNALYVDGRRAAHPESLEQTSDADGLFSNTASVVFAPALVTGIYGMDIFKRKQWL